VQSAAQAAVTAEGQEQMGVRVFIGISKLPEPYFPL
jgi:hypothetical protein